MVYVGVSLDIENYSDSVLFVSRPTGLELICQPEIS